MINKLYSFHIDIVDLFIYVLAWASMWYIYDYMILKYVGTNPETVFYANVAILAIAVLLLLIRNMFIYQYR